MEMDLLLNRSELLMQNIGELIAHPLYDQSIRLDISAQACFLSLEHAAAVRLLASNGMMISAPVMLRCQFEALTRGIWSLYCAADEQLELLSIVLSEQSVEAGRSMPSASVMLQALKAVPNAAEPMRCLSEFKEHSWKALNSYVHSGLHAFRRQAEGYPAELAIGMVRQSNGLMMLAGMQIALLTGVPGGQKLFLPLNERFGDCFLFIGPRDASESFRNTRRDTAPS